MKIQEAPIFKLEICIDNLGNVYYDTHTLKAQVLKDSFELWNKGYPHTHKLIQILSAAKAMSEKLYEELQAYVQEIE